MTVPPSRAAPPPRARRGGGGGDPLPVQGSDAAEEPEELGRGGGDDRLRHRRASSEGGAEMARDRLRPNPTAPRPPPVSAGWRRGLPEGAPAASAHGRTRQARGRRARRVR